MDFSHLELDRVDVGTAWDIQRAFHETISRFVLAASRLNGEHS
jgi:hypothetical protein